MKCKNCEQNYWFGDYALNYCKVDKEIITDESECRFMCLGMANGAKSPEMNYLNKKIRVDDLGRIAIPNEMLKRLGIVDGDILQITATENLIVIEKCEVEEE